jgi:glycine/D-amino acid oxidase-like deaminating enzyme
MKIAVIGAGIFGLEIATELINSGNDVTIFESKSDVFNGATGNSILRLHLGLHYPRDLETAIQSRDGYEAFIRKYEECVNISFNNYYALSRENSKVSETEFQNFTKKAGISIKPIPTQDIKDLGIDTNRITKIWSCREGVIDLQKLKEVFINQIAPSGKLYFNTEIVEVEKIKGIWQIIDKDRNEYEFDFVIRATYGTDRITSKTLEIEKRKIKYQKTFILEIGTNQPQFGFTVIDGDFITVLPKGFGNTFLLYAPSPSVLDRYIGNKYPDQWDSSEYFNFNEAEEMLAVRYKYWFPEVENFKILNNYHTVRSLQPNVTKTDKRVSTLNVKANGFIDVWSGKIDHCVEIGIAINQLIKNQ